GWDDDEAGRASGFGKRDYAGITLHVGLVSRKVGNVEYVFGLCDAGEREVRMIAQLDHRFLLQVFDDGWRTMHCDRTKCISFAQEQIAELGLAEACRGRQHGLEHGL